MTIYELFDYIISLANELKLLNGENSNLALEYQNQRSSLLTYLILTQLGFIGLVFVFCVFISHKIAGPMYKLINHLRQIRESDQVEDIHFREGDQFPEVAHEINLTINYLKQKSEEEVEYLSEVLDYIENIALVVPEDKKPVLDEIQRKIKEIQVGRLK